MRRTGAPTVTASPRSSANLIDSNWDRPANRDAAVHAIARTYLDAGRRA
ncbi:hypothetical protein [Crossiella sp. NPDC003009]